MTKKILIATGGTGGHIYPAMALAQQLAAEVSDSQVLFVGGGLNENRYFDRTLFSHQAVDCGAFLKKSPRFFFRAVSGITKGIWQSRRIIHEFKPNVVVGFGSYYSFPPLIAARLMSIPIILHEANSIPGKVNRLLARWAEVTGVHFPDTSHLLKGKTVEVGMPLRFGFRRTSISQKEARCHFNLLPDLPVLLVFGGSQGARLINSLTKEAIFQLKGSAFQLLHITGDEVAAQELAKAYQERGVHACVKTFEKQMELAWQAADMVICRSGAGTIAEQLEFEVPGILIPFSRAADNHQEYNADFMVARVGGAVKLHEKEMAPARLAACLAEFLKEDRFLLTGMRRAMSLYKKRSRNRDLCSLVRELL